MTAPIYHLQGLSKKYGNRRVLNINTMDIQQGEAYALVGPSGAGKSTLLRLLNFLEQPTSGHIEFHGEVYGPESPVPVAVRRRITTVFQRPVLQDQSVWDNVTYGLRLRGMMDSADLTRSVLDRVGLLHLARQRARTLSGGEAQRVALARAMILQPDVLLLDEPTANLDPYNVSLIEEIVTSINQQHGTTLVLVTHNVFQARRMAHRVGLLLDGEVIEEGDAEIFFNNPHDPRTGAFVRGEMVY